MKNPIFPARQHGAALAVVLLVLLVVSMIAIGAMRGAILEERMASNQLERSFAFQAAEAALRAGEARAQGAANGDEGKTEDAIKVMACTAGLCGTPVAGAADVWTVESNWTNAPSVSRTMKIGDDGAKTVTKQAKYIVELIASNIPDKERATSGGDTANDTTQSPKRSIYQITARSGDRSSGEVLLQSTYEVPKQI